MSPLKRQHRQLTHLHMKITQKIVVPALIALAHTASHAQINGQLFIVQRNQAVVKLALVTVLVYPEHEFNMSLNKTKEENEKIISSISAELAKTKEKAKVEEEVVANSKITLQLMSAKLKATNTEPNYAERYDLYWNLYKNIEKAEEDIRKHKEIITQAERKIANLKGLENYISNLPNASYKTRSNADGFFRLNVPGGNYVILAQSSRFVYGEKNEKYNWLVRIDTKGGGADVLLSNDNLYETNCEDCVRFPK
jgi:hypothetical protein